jgi:hypothetical protein
MKVNYCDICGNILVKRKFLVRKLEVELNQNEIPRCVTDQIVDKEICVTCNQIMNMLFNIRRKKLDRLRKQLERMYTRRTQRQVKRKTRRGD